MTLTYKDVFSTCFCCSTTTATKCYFLQFKEKRTYNGLPDFMTTVAREELNKLSSSITECNVIYLPQVILTSIELSKFVFLCTNAYFPNFFPSVLTYFFSPQLGYLLAIPRSPEMKEEDDFAMDGLEFVVRWLFIDKAYIQLNPVLGGQPHNCSVVTSLFRLPTVYSN